MGDWSISRTGDRLFVESQGNLEAFMKAWQCGPCPVHIMRNRDKRALPSIPLLQMQDIELTLKLDDIEVTVKNVKQSIATTVECAIDEKVVTAILNMVKLFAEEELQIRGMSVTQDVFNGFVGMLLCRATEAHLMKGD